MYDDDLHDMDELRAHLVDDGTISAVHTICQKCGQRVPAQDLYLETYGFMWLKMRLVCPACYGVEQEGGGDGQQR